VRAGCFCHFLDIKERRSMTSDATPESANTSILEDDFLIVGLGASAGGIQALKDFFANVPKNTGIAYVVILHMSPEHESRLAEVLQTTAQIPVTQVTQRVKVVPNHVYVIPPNQNLAMTDGHLKLTTMIGIEERRSPVDLFFRTLAETNDSRAVSVILSGTGSNGSMGLKRIKEYGGVAFVQDPNEAQYMDMPRNAIATGLVDYVLPVAEIPEKILSYRQHRGTIQIPESHETLPTDEQALRDIFTQLRMRTGHDFSNYKRATMLRRIERRVGIKELSGLPQYVQFLRENRDEAQALMKDLLISVTNFFRDPASVEALAKKVLSAIVDRKREGDHIRVWIAGCATGEEAYTLAILLNESFESVVTPQQIQIFATDLDAEAIAIAREGYYSQSEVADLSPERLRRFFVKEHEGYRIRRELRETILFAVHNVIKDPPFSHLDLVSCRNLLIYLNRAAQARVFEVVHFALNPGGHLFLGASESIEGSLDLFSIVDKEHHIYQGRPVPTRVTLPIPEVTFKPPVLAPIGKDPSEQEVRAIERLSYVDLHQRLLEEFAPPSVVVNEEYDIVHLSEHAGEFLQIRGGGPTNNLLKLIRPELRLDVRTALHQALQKGAAVQTRAIDVSTTHGTKRVNVLVRPVLREGDPNHGFILLVFQEKTKATQEAPTVTLPVEPIARQLEEELINAKSQLRATVEQYEVQQEELRASNEELQAMNEELRSAAEELETSKEELQSVNEELTTVNQELKVKIEELSQANNDFSNLMNSTDIGTIFLDRGLRVKQFTSRAVDVFNLISADRGRPLADITHKLNYEQLLEDVENVLETLLKFQREVETVDNRWYLLRILPYRTSEDRIEGVVITFLNVTASRIAKRDLEAVRKQLEASVGERTRELQEANESLWSEVSERRQSETSRMRILTQLVTAQEAERSRVARELHDQLGQQLTALRLKLESLKGGAGKREQLEADVNQLLDLTSQLDSDVDFLAWQLRPVALDDLGLADALRVYVRQWSDHVNIATEFHTVGLEKVRPSPEVENNLYRIAQEALNNVAKHSGASRVDVLLERRDSHAVLIIEDDGQGFSLGDQIDASAIGLMGIRERASLLGGSMELETAPEKGTTLIVRVPLTVGGGGVRI
jgi:two-component system, chemotaxis family, CheB/CheR fusion protein